MKILIAEDEKPIANSLKKNLLLEGFEASIAGDGEATLNELQNTHYDLLLLDWRMPKKNGYEVCLELRQSGNNIPIILLTALNDVSNKVAALNAGADDYITKPFSIEEVKARIDSVLRRIQSAKSKINCGIFSLNLISHTIESGLNTIRLSEKEFDLLNFLVINQGVVVNRDSLHEKVWGLNFSPSTNFVEVTIKNLRKKIEELTSVKCIKTIYGEGYVFLGE
jgi:DNA-binding response OmpR family regulator